MEKPFTIEQMKSALIAIRPEIAEPQMSMLRGHYLYRVLSMGRIAKFGGYSYNGSANLLYGKLCGRIARELGYRPTGSKTYTIASVSPDRDKKGEFSCCSVAQIASGCDGAEPFSLWRSENTVNNLPLDKGAQEGIILRGFKQVDQPITGVEKTDRSLAHGNPTRLNGSFQFQQLFPAHNLSYGWHIKLKKQGEQRQLFPMPPRFDFQRGRRLKTEEETIRRKGKCALRG